MDRVSNTRFSLRRNATLIGWLVGWLTFLLRGNERQASSTWDHQEKIIVLSKCALNRKQWFTANTEFIQNLWIQDVHGQPLITFSREPHDCHSPLKQDERLSSEICQIRVSWKYKINTFPFSLSYPRWFLNFCTFVNSQKHEQNDMNITNANFFVPNKLLYLPSFPKFWNGREWTPHSISS